MLVIRINKASPSKLKHFLFSYLKDYGFNSVQVKEMIQSLSEVGNSFHSKSHVIYIDRLELILIKNQEEIDAELEIFEHTSAIIYPLKIKFTSTKKEAKKFKNSLGQFDISKLKFPLQLRLWKAGDRIQPLGMKGSKKVSDVLIDKKVSRADKKQVRVLVSDNEVIWLIGIMINDNFKLDKDSEIIWQAELI